MSILTSLNMTTDASKSRLPAQPSTSLSKPTTSTPNAFSTVSGQQQPIALTSDNIRVAPAGRQPPVPRQPAPQLPPARPPAQDADADKLAAARQQLFADDADADAGKGRARNKANVTMSFEKKQAANVTIKMPQSNAGTAVQTQAMPQSIGQPAQTAQASPGLPVAVPGQNSAGYERGGRVVSPEVSAFNAGKAADDKFRTVESSLTVRVPVTAGNSAGDDADRLQAEIVQLKSKMHAMAMEHDDRIADYDARLRQHAKALEQAAAEARRFQDEKKELLGYKRDFLIAKDELATLKAGIEERRDQTTGPHPDTVRLAQVQASIGALQASKEKLQEENEEKEQKILRLESEVTTLIQKIKTLATRESQQAEEIARERQNLQQRERQFVETRDALTQQAERHQQRSAQLERELAALQADRELREQQVSAELASLNERLLRTDDANSDLREQVRALEDDLAERAQVNAAVQERQKAEKALSSENARLRDQVSQLTADIAELQTSLAEAREALAASQRVHLGELQAKQLAAEQLETELRAATALAEQRDLQLAEVEASKGGSLRAMRELVRWHHAGS